jgi:hypothetical protein
MKERPILFSGEMVRAILQGRKVMTRRVIKLPPADGRLRFNGSRFEVHQGYPIGHVEIPCPYGQPGDRLWVRETWGCDKPKSMVGRAKWEGPPNQDEAEVHWKQAEEEIGTLHIFPSKYWRSPIFMPRWASRITLEITNIKVERVQDILPQDILAEGIHMAISDEDHSEQYEAFEELWDSINAKRGFGWNKNPWVWAIEFRKASV